MSPATATTVDPRAASRVGDRPAAALGSRAANHQVVATPSASTRAITSPRPRLAPVTIATRVVSAHASSPHLPSERRTSSALEVKRKFLQAARMDDVLTIGEVARRSGVATSALRFYEEHGLIRSVRNQSGHRRYPRAVLRARRVHRLRAEVGLSLDEVKVELARLPTQSRARARGLGEAVGEVDSADPCAHRGARAASGRTDRMHRMRLSVTRPLRHGESRRSRRAPRSWSTLLGHATLANAVNSQASNSQLPIGCNAAQDAARRL